MLVRTFEGHIDRVCEVAFSLDGEHILSKSRDNIFKLWEAKTGYVIQTLGSEEPSPLWASFSPNVSTHFVIKRLKQHSDFTTVASSPDGKVVVSGRRVANAKGPVWAYPGTGDDMLIELWDVGTSKLIHSYNLEVDNCTNGRIDIVLFSNDGQTVLSYSSSVWYGEFERSWSDMQLWDVSEWTQR